MPTWPTGRRGSGSYTDLLVDLVERELEDRAHRLFALRRGRACLRHLDQRRDSAHLAYRHLREPDR
jgi:hypothetical protein